MKETQADMILRYMKAHGSITTFDAYEMGCTRLSGRIFDLKRRGYAIRSVTETGKNRYGSPVSYTRYSLEISEGDV